MADLVGLESVSCVNRHPMLSFLTKEEGMAASPLLTFPWPNQEDQETPLELLLSLHHCE